MSLTIGAEVGGSTSEVLNYSGEEAVRAILCRNSSSATVSPLGGEALCKAVSQRCRTIAQ
jgi:hypothetical protein